MDKMDTMLVHKLNANIGQLMFGTVHNDEECEVVSGNVTLFSARLFIFQISKWHFMHSILSTQPRGTWKSVKEWMNVNGTYLPHGKQFQGECLSTLHEPSLVSFLSVAMKHLKCLAFNTTGYRSSWCSSFNCLSNTETNKEYTPSSPWVEIRLQGYDFWIMIYDWINKSVNATQKFHSFIRIQQNKNWKNYYFRSSFSGRILWKPSPRNARKFWTKYLRNILQNW